MKDMKSFLVECQPLLEKDMLETETDSIVRLGLAEASRFAAIHEVSLVTP